MLTKIEVTKTYWIGVEADQKDDLLAGILTALKNDEIPNSPTDLSTASIEALSALRLALLNA